MSLQDPVGLHGREVTQRYALLDKFLTGVTKNGCRLLFLITEIYEDGCYGGSLVRADDPHGFTEEWYEEVTNANLRDWGWTLIDGPSVQRGAAH